MQSVEKTFEVMELIGQSVEGISLDAMSKVIPYPKATLHRICKCLCHCGYIRQASHGKYFLTTKLVTLGYSVIQNDSLVNDATPILSELANQTRFTVNLQRRDVDKVILLKKEEPKNSAFHTNAHAGLASSLHHSACGKVVLSYFNQEEKSHYWQNYSLDINTFEHFGSRDITNEQDFLSELDQIKSSGFALDGEGNESGITCIAVPLQVEGMVQYAISVSGLTPEIHRYGQQNIVRELLAAAQKLSAII
jgi:DNA-binding IclR family transcriptional regulator